MLKKIIKGQYIHVYWPTVISPEHRSLLVCTSEVSMGKWKQDWLIYIFRSLSGNSEKGNQQHEKHPSCLSPTATLCLRHCWVVSAQLSCWFSSMRDWSSCELSRREKETRGCGSAAQPTSDFIFSHAGSVDLCVTTGHKKEHTYAPWCPLPLACVSPAQLRLSDFSTLWFTCQENRLHAEISGNHINSSLTYFNCSTIQTAA